MKKSKIISNKSASRKFKIEEKIEAGIQLLGSEVKAVRLNHVDLNSSYVKIINNEAFLINAKIFPYKYSRVEGYDESRTRKLLLHRKEIQALKSKMESSSLTIIPLSMYTIGVFIKVKLGLAKGKKMFEKRRELKKKAVERDIQREIKESIRG